MSKQMRPQLEMRNLADLKPHPLQADYFDILPDNELQALADDIRRTGLREAIEVMPRNKAGLAPNTIVSGHMRRLALQKNGETDVQVLVRYDLADADAAEVERVLLEQNQNRRQLPRLEQARIVLRLYEIERGRKRGELASYEQGEARDRVGKQIQMSGRHLQRYFNVLRTPPEVQKAYSDHRLSVTEAARVAGLASSIQQKIALRIQKGEAPKKVVSEYNAPSQNGSQKYINIRVHVFNAIVKGINDLRRSATQVQPHIAPNEIKCLQRTKQLIDELITVLGGQSDAAQDVSTRRA